jgi:hypothetical protein
MFLWIILSVLVALLIIGLLSGMMFVPALMIIGLGIFIALLIMRRKSRDQA